MQKLRSDFQHWQAQLTTVSFPKWKELPTLGLYVDQVVTVVNEQLATLEVEPLTKSMVNNYVKKKVIQAPVKKKYAVNQVVDLLLICFFKVSFPIDSIRKGIAQVTIKTYPQRAYDSFVDLLSAKLAGQPVPQNEELTAVNRQLIEYAIDAVLAHLKAAHLLAGMQKDEQPLTVEKG